MTTTKPKRVTKRQAEKVLTQIKKRFKPWIDAGTEPPTIVMDFDPGYVGVAPFPAIVWEAGPYEWALKDWGGDIDEEFGFRLAPITRPEGVFTEPWNGFVLGVYPDYWT